MDLDDQQRELVRSWGIQKGPGSHKHICPACSDQRSKKSAKVMTITNDGEKILYKCWHCDVAGAVRIEGRLKDREFRPSPAPVTAKPRGAVKSITQSLDPIAVRYLKQRGISVPTAALYGASSARAYFPDLKRETPALAFPYDRERKDHGHKIRSTDEKAHVCDKPLASLFGIDLVDLAESGDLIICEGELDALSMREAGVLNATSVPNGASSFTQTSSTDDKAVMSFLWPAKELIDKAKRIVIATDMDDPGDKLAEELARRIGRHRCWRVRFADDCKDANDQLLKVGAKSFAALLEGAEPWPIDGLYGADVFIPELFKLYDDGLGERVFTGLAPVDEIYSAGPGLLTVITGIPGHGKSTFVDQLMINMARMYGHSFAICSFENPIHIHMAKLSEMLLQKHFFEPDNKPGYRMTRDELESVQPFLVEHFKFLSQDDGKKATLDSIIERIRTAVFRWGIRGAVIDPYNYISRPSKAESETVWIDDMLTQLRLLAQVSGIHLWFIAHPFKMPMDGDGNYTPPRGYSISGSAAWYSKPDFGLTVHRGEGATVQVINWKTRFSWLGKEGTATLLYDNQHNVYLSDGISDLPPMDYAAGKYGDDHASYH